MSELSYKRTNVYEVADEAKLKAIFDYAKGYAAFLDAGKTEREACAYAVAAAEKAGYIFAEKNGLKLLRRDSIREEISRLQKQKKNVKRFMTMK